MCSFGRSGDSYFVSYRDPNLQKTIEVFENAVEAIAHFEADDRTMTQYLIGAISSLDRPLTPKEKGGMSLYAYMTNLTDEEVQKTRDELLNTTVEDIRALSKYLQAFLDDQYLCVVGNMQTIQAQEELFAVTEELL
jgi:Zn-dependent M16 (insulinase) family peptidase